MSRKIAVVGAGIAGASCARALADADIAVSVFEKSRGPGGRMATRRATSPLGKVQFDHGAPYFSAFGDDMRARVADWEARGLCTAWDAAFEMIGASGAASVAPGEHYVGLPRMSALTRDLLSGTELHTKTRITHVRPGASGPTLCTDDEEFGPFDAAVIAMPAPQAAPLLAELAPELSARAAKVVMDPVWSAMVSFEKPLELPYGVAYVGNSPLFLICRDSGKPGRPETESWLLLSTTEWAEDHIEDEPAAVAGSLLEALWKVTGLSPQNAAFSAAHLWRHARVHKPLAEPYFWDGEHAIGACGDWFRLGSAEGAYVSGLHLARAIAGR